MTERERLLETYLFGNPDRIPLVPGGGRESTLNRWRSEGLPEGADPYTTALRHIGVPEDEWPKGGEMFRINHRMIPEFEAKVIERKEDSQIVQDWKGNVCEIGLEFTVEHLINAIDFCTRRWIKCPVENRSDWEDMRRRYDPEDPARLPENSAELGERLKKRTHPITIGVHGPYWQLREWLGFEGLSMMFYDDPEFVKEMIDFWKDYISRLLERALEHCVPDMFHISEDMAYKGYSMVSPDMCREFLLPCWKQWGEIIRSAGVPLYGVDSDGFIGELIPIWMEAGVNECDPIEVAAGNDIVEFRRKFGKKMAYQGGVDKREMAKGGAHIEAEMKRLEPVIKSGGYIPSCDHGIPSDVSWPNFLHYVELLAKATGWI